MVKDVNDPVGEPTHDEKAVFQADTDNSDHAHHDNPVGGGRRASMAANIIENPLTRLSKEQNVIDAKLFCEQNGLAEHSEMFARAALVAREELGDHNNVAGLLEDEKAALDYEWKHKWFGSVPMWYTVGLCAVGAATQGWDQTGSNGANLSFPKEFGLEGTARGEWIVGIINAIIFLTAGLIGAWIVDPLNHYLGRRGEIFVTGLCLTATPIGSGFARTWQELFAARFVMGIGIGAKNATVPIFSSEIAPARIRGALVMFWQLWVVIGIFLGFSANVILKDIPRIAWRLELGSACLPSIVLTIGVYFCPESPRWLMKHGKIAKGFQSMDKLRAHPIIAARDYYYSYVIHQEEVVVAAGAGYFRRLADCFTIPRIRRANYGASTAMLAQQLCGINIISFYSSSIFSDAGYSDDEALFASLGYGAIQVVFTIPTLFLIDPVGRRRLCLITFPIMAVFLLAAGLSLLNKDGPRAEQIGPVVFFVYCFTIAYCLGEGPVAFQYSAEVFPNIQREQGMAWAVCINNTFAGVLSLTFPRMRSPDVMTPTGAFIFYAGLNLVGWLLVFCFIRETKQLTLEELDQVFSVPTSKFLSNECKVRVPYFWKRHFFRQNIPKPPNTIEKARVLQEKTAAA